MGSRNQKLSGEAEDGKAHGSEAAAALIGKKRGRTQRHLPQHLVELILRRLRPFKAVALGAVSETWEAAARCHNPATGTKPWILTLSPDLANVDERKDVNDRRYRLVNVLGGGSVELRLPFGTRFIGSPHGWLLLLDIYNRGGLSLLNPFTSACIDLPAWPWIWPPPFFSYLSSAPTAAGCVLFVRTENHDVLLWKAGDDHWTLAKGNHERRITHVVAAGSKLYALDEEGRVRCLHEASNSFPLLDVPSLVPSVCEKWGYYEGHLVESNEDVLLVQPLRACHYSQFFSHNAKGFVSFRIFRLDLVNRVWVRVHSLESRSLFLGMREFDCSLSVAAAEAGCRPNCIYFIPWENQIFDMKQQRILHIKSPSDGYSYQFKCSLDFWFLNL